MIVADSIDVMLLTEAKCQLFTPKSICDAEVDEMVGTALAAPSAIEQA